MINYDCKMYSNNRLTVLILISNMYKIFPNIVINLISNGRNLILSTDFYSNNEEFKKNCNAEVQQKVILFYLFLLKIWWIPYRFYGFYTFYAFCLLKMSPQILFLQSMTSMTWNFIHEIIPLFGLTIQPIILLIISSSCHVILLTQMNTNWAEQML